MLINDNKTLNNLLEKVMISNSAIKKLDDIDIKSYYNCYCFVAKVFGWVNELSWLHWDEMDAYLFHNTRAIYEPETPEIGDIAVWRTDSGHLEHTALIIGDELDIIQKPGETQLEAGKMHTPDIYNYSKYYTITYRRVLL